MVGWLAALGCADGPVLSKINTEPAVVFVSHDDGEQIVGAGPVRFVALTSDPESPAEDLEVGWLLDGLTVCEGAVVEVDDTAACEVTLGAGLHEVTVVVTDPDGARATVLISVEVVVPNTAPSCGLTEPADGAVLALGEALVVRGEVSDGQSAPETLRVEVDSSLNGVLGVAVPTSAGAFTLAASGLTGGTHVLTARVEDPEGAVCTDARTVHVLQAPVITLVAPADGAVFDLGEPVRLAALIEDADGDPATVSVRWSSDVGGPLGETSPTSAGEAEVVVLGLSRGPHVWSVEAEDVDGLRSRADRALLVNGPPSAPGVEIAPALPLPGDALLAQITVPSTDLEGDAVSYTYLWLRDGVAVGTSSTIGAGVVRRGELWTLRVVASDGRLEAPVVELSATIGNRPPVAGSVQLSPVSPVTGVSQFAVPVGSDPDGDPITWRYTWSVDGAVVQASASAELAPRTRGERVEVTAVASDGVDESNAVSFGPVTIGNAPPSLASVAISPQAPAITDTLSCVPSGWSDPEGDPPGYRWAWRAGGVVVPAHTQSTVAASAFAQGTAISCVAVPWDGRIEGAARTSSEVSVGNSPPEVLAGTLTPAMPTRLDAIELIDVLTDDPDLDPVTVSVAWLVQGVQVGTGNRLAPGFHLRGNVVTARITPNDGRVAGPVFPLSVVVANADPVLSAATLEPLAPVTTSTLSGAFVASDPDGDAVSAVWRWEVSGSEIVGVTGPTLDGVFFDEGDSVRGFVTVHDGNGGSDQRATNTVIVGNTAPGAPVVRIDPPVSDTTIGLRCEVLTESSDVDGDPVSYRMSWRLNGAPFLGPVDSNTWQGDTLPPSQLAPGRWTCEATSNDGDVDGAVGTDDARVVAPYVGPRVATSGGQACALLVDGELICWGDNLLGALGQGDTNDRGDQPGELAALAPIPLGVSRSVEQVAVGGDFVCALLDDGSVKCWGDNSVGQLGLGSTSPRGALPNQLGDALPFAWLGPEVAVAQLVAGEDHACVRTRDGRVKCWGGNAQGQLGLGDTAPRGVSAGQLGASLPWVDLGTDRGAIDLAAGAAVTCAVLDDTTVKCWGDNGTGVSGASTGGEVGDQAEELGDALAAVALRAGEVVDVETDGASACARFADGGLTCWGDNDAGQLGQGDVLLRRGHEVAGLPAIDLGVGFVVAEVAMRDGTVCARSEAGQLKCWGRNDGGQLGLGDQDARGVAPGQLGEALEAVWLHRSRDVVGAAVGGSFACAELSCGELQCWGTGLRGQLGLGDVRPRGDDPRELDDALPTLDLGAGRRLWTDGAVGPTCDRWSRAVTVDGRDDDWVSAMVLPTSAAANTALMVSWDETYVYVGTRHPDVSAGNDQHWFVAYFGNGSDRAAVISEPGFRFGITHNTQVPGLAVEAQVVARVKATGSYNQLARANYPAGVPTWEGGAYELSSGGSGAQLARDGGENVIELRVRRDVLQLHRVLYVQAHWLYERSNFETSYAASPTDMFNDGAYDPEFDSYWRIELDHPLGPQAAAAEGALP